MTVYAVCYGKMQADDSGEKRVWRLGRAKERRTFSDKRDALVCFAERKGNLRADFLMEGMRCGNFRHLMKDAGLGVELRRETYLAEGAEEDAGIAAKGCAWLGGEILHAASYTYDDWCREFGTE